MAVWALARLLPREEFLSLAGGHGEEGDAEIQAEWDDAINREGTR
jgi:hypothetical protein